MWGGGQGNRQSPERFSRASNGTNGESASEGQVAAAAALAARMAFANAYDMTQPAAPASSYFDVYGAAAGQPSTLGDREDAAILYAQRARELELFHLQQHIQERQVIENEARTRLLDYAARNQIQEYERTRIEMALIAEMHQRDRGARMEAERGRNLSLVDAHVTSQHEIDAADAQNPQGQHLAEYLAQQNDRAIDYDSTPPPRWLPADLKETSALTEIKAEGSTIKKESTSFHDAVEPVQKKETPSQKQSSSTTSPSPKKDPPLKKDPPPTKVAPPKKDGPKKKKAPLKEEGDKKAPNKEEGENKAQQKEEGETKALQGDEGESKAPQKEEGEKKEPLKEEAGSLKVPLSTPSSSQLVSDKKITPVEKSSTILKKRKTPSKASGATPTNGNHAKKARKSPSGPAGGKATTPPPNSLLVKQKTGVPSMDDTVPDITDIQYENAKALMTEFCKVPFLSEFSRPVSLLHPELVTLYSKIVTNPMDLGHVCRAIRRREYINTRAIQLDVWQVFSNCIKFHMSPSNRDNAIPSFISIAIHLRDFFNSLWQEYMMPSDAPPRLPGKGISHIHSTFQKRAEARKARLPQISSTILTPKCMQKLATTLESFISSGGKVDNLDKDAILGDIHNATGDIATCISSLRGVITNMKTQIQNNLDYTVLELHRDVKKCYTEDVFEYEILKKMKISQRLDRILGKTFAPIHESSCRGVNQSSIWGCMAAAVWARESKKKPYWPAIVLGILAPDDQKEDWHQALTDRNEARLPEKLRADLLAAKRRAEQGLKKSGGDPMSYFLVEFMGSHEFIWVKESDIIENFDPDEDVNIATAAGNVTKKKRSTAFNSKQMSDAIEEGRWALEEFELQLNNSCGDHSDDESEFDESGYTFDSLCQSDAEADERNELHKKSNKTDIDELNELLAADGLPDFSIEGRKKAKARAAALKKENALLVKKEKEKEKEKEKAKKNKPKPPTKDEAKKFEKQLELEDKRAQERRIKRARDHEKSLKELERKAKRMKSNVPEKKNNPNEVPNKRIRADMIAKGFLMRKCIKDASFIGAAFQPTSSVEPSGLLGMALAFRAAAGEVPFVDTNIGTPFVQEDWEKIDADSPSESAERCKRLLEQIDLIAKAIEKVDADTERRIALTADAEKARSAAQKRIIDAENEVRSTFASKKKKPAKKGESVKVDDDIIMPDVLTGEDRGESANIPEVKSGQTETEVTHTEMVDEQWDT